MQTITLLTRKKLYNLLNKRFLKENYKIVVLHFIFNIFRLTGFENKVVEYESKETSSKKYHNQIVCLNFFKEAGRWTMKMNDYLKTINIFYTEKINAASLIFQ